MNVVGWMKILIKPYSIQYQQKENTAEVWKYGLRKKGGKARDVAA